MEQNEAQSKFILWSYQGRLKDFEGPSQIHRDRPSRVHVKFYKYVHTNFNCKTEVFNCIFRTNMITLMKNKILLYLLFLIKTFFFGLLLKEMKQQPKLEENMTIWVLDIKISLDFI